MEDKDSSRGSEEGSATGSVTPPMKYDVVNCGNTGATGEVSWYEIGEKSGLATGGVGTRVVSPSAPDASSQAIFGGVGTLDT